MALASGETDTHSNKTVRAIGEEIAKTGLSEEELMAKLETVRQRLFDETYRTQHDLTDG